MTITYKEERLSADEYIEFLKRSDLGKQYPKERFHERIGKLVRNVSISLIARGHIQQLWGGHSRAGSDFRYAREEGVDQPVGRLPEYPEAAVPMDILRFV
ncbi:MAG: hypothetical protein MJ084_04105 [Saccharofermentans sp.]|nr:hypothetical protein [Saccharofermentans sp.]